MAGEGYEGRILTQSSHHGSYDLVRSNPAAPGVEPVIGMVGPICYVRPTRQRVIRCESILLATWDLHDCFAL